MSEHITKEQMIERYKKLGIPMPLEPITNQPAMSGNPDKLKKIEEIRNGFKKNEFNNILQADGPTKGFTPLPVPRPKHAQSKSKDLIPEVKSNPIPRNEEADSIERMLFGDSTTTQVSSQALNRKDLNYNTSNGDFVQEFRNKMQNKIQETVAKTTTPTHQDGYITINEEDLNKRISEISREISKEVSKKMIKSVLLEYAKDGQGLIVETEKVKKAEIVNKNTVKIGGKLYKLTPITQS
jgi:hypothetical protein